MRTKITLALVAAVSFCTIPGFGQDQQQQQQAPDGAQQQQPPELSQPQAPPPPFQQQPQQPSNGGWRRANADPGAPGGPASRDEYGQPQYNGGPQQPQMNTGRPPMMPAMPPPSQLIIPAGTWISIRVNQPISSDHNVTGDTFAATLAQPLIADGFVVARRGQSVEGRVSEAVKAGRATGTSRLGVELIQFGLVDGRQMPLRTQLMEYRGGTSVGRDIAAAGTVTGTGAAIGAAAGGGVGAAIGAAAGAVVSGIGVLSTRGRATEIYPEAEVTFRTMEPISINTERSAQAFMPVRQQDYEPTLQQRGMQPPAVVVQRAPMYPYYGGGYYGSYFGPGWGYSPFWGPSLYFYSGPRFYGGFHGGGGFRGGRR